MNTVNKELDNNSKKYQSLLAQCWIGMLFLEFGMFMVAMTLFGMEGNFSGLNDDPGVVGLWLLSGIMCFNTLMQIAIRVFDSVWFRWFIFGLTLAYTFFFLAHQADHLSNGQRNDMNMLFDITHHLIGLLGTYWAYRWARHAKTNLSATESLQTGAQAS